MLARCASGSCSLCMLRTASTAIRVVRAARMWPQTITPATAARPRARRPPIPRRSLNRPDDVAGETAARAAAMDSAVSVGISCIRHKPREAEVPKLFLGRRPVVRIMLASREPLPWRPSQKHNAIVHWLKSPQAISADITPQPAGKKRGFCPLRPGSTGGFGRASLNRRGRMRRDPDRGSCLLYTGAMTEMRGT